MKGYSYTRIGLVISPNLSKNAYENLWFRNRTVNPSSIIFSIATHKIIRLIRIVYSLIELIGNHLYILFSVVTKRHYALAVLAIYSFLIIITMINDIHRRLDETLTSDINIDRIRSQLFISCVKIFFRPGGYIACELEHFFGA